MNRKTFLKTTAASMLAVGTKGAHASIFDTTAPTNNGLKIRFLGTGAADWKGKDERGEHRRLSSILMDEKIFIDLTAENLEMIPSSAHPDTIFYTHSHSDHYHPATALRAGVKRVYLSQSWYDIAKGDFSGRNFRFGVRELGMAAIMNGITVHGGLRAFGGTFFVFCDYCRPVMRVAALMGLPVIYVLTHDSFYVGEDGPTHEPIEQLPAMRAMPNMCVLRPADATETSVAWEVALSRKHGPTALLLSRQNLPIIDRTVYPSADNAAMGAYILWQRNPNVAPDAILIASGSEVSLALEAAQADARNIRVVSMPSWELFEAQSPAYRNRVLPANVKKRIAVEAASPFGWERYLGESGISLTMGGFGASGPAEKLAEHFGFTVANLTALINDYLSK